MKKFALDFLRRGLVACGFGPIVLAIVYLILNKNGVVDVLSVGEAATGIFSLTALAFIAGGMNAVYQIERLPLMLAILLHGGVLYASYLATYLVNNWLETSMIPILAFTGVFVVGYFAIWAVIYCVIRRRTKRINEILNQKR
ncbi:MAG: DUF3021 domain-containing protein [Clostridia bacterium]|nr:DUF3021 domain-containing protein [Clostridia bacterium]MBQ2434484.1 DUF3021 domain-containing protein [Clostridia bacterium]